jgi:hypothetical protein
MSTPSDAEENEAHGRSSDQPLPRTQAPRSGEPQAAGRVSPAEKSEPSGVPVEEQHHNADPNAPQTQVSPPGESQVTPEETGGVPASSLRQGPDDGTDEARRAAQVKVVPPPPDAGEGSVRQTNEPNESRPEGS